MGKESRTARLFAAAMVSAVLLLGITTYSGASAASPARPQVAGQSDPLYGGRSVLTPSYHRPLGVLPSASAQAQSLPSRNPATAPLNSDPCTPDVTCSPLLYQGGPTMGTTSVIGKTSAPGRNTVYALFWDPTPSSFPYPIRYSTLIDQYLSDVAHTSGRPTNAYATSQQYTGLSAVRLRYDVTFGGSYVVRDKFPHAGCPIAQGEDVCLSDAQVERELSRAIGELHATADLSHLYMVFLPENVETCFTAQGNACSSTTTTGNFCAYHDAVSEGHHVIVYANMPFPSLGECATHIQSPNGTIFADVEISLIAHEQNEAITDPLGNAWHTNAPKTKELGDLCREVFGATFPTGPSGAQWNQTINGHHYFTQDLFSNEDFFTTGTAGGCIDKEEPPTATFSAISSIGVGESDTFSAAGSGDPDSPKPVTYLWNWGDGSSVGQGLVTSHAFSVPGTYTVKLTVLTADGWSATVVRVIHVTLTPKALTVASDGIGYCAVLTTGGIRCWGGGYTGDLGDGSTAKSNNPVDVVGITDASRVVSGRYGGFPSYCALLSTGSVNCWGSGFSGMLGDGATTSSDVPVAVTGITTAIGIAGTGDGYCALLSTGAIECWGNGQFGQLGDGTTAFAAMSNVPAQVVGITNATDLVAHGQGYCAVLATGGIECWGGNLGNGSTGSSAVPVGVVGIGNAVSVTSGLSSSCALLASGNIACWGSGAYGQLGDGSTTNSYVPVGVSGVTNAVSVSGYYEGYCAVLSTGSVACWGTGQTGRLGDGSTRVSNILLPVTGVTNARGLLADGSGYCAILSSGDAACWGRGSFGVLGDGSTTNSKVPVAVAGVTNVTQLANSYAGRCAILSLGGIDCWGLGRTGQLGDGSTTSSNVPVSVFGVG